MRYYSIIAVLLLSGVLAACGTSAAGDNPPVIPPSAAADPQLAGTDWTLIELGDPAAPTPALSDARPTIAFDEQTATGSTGCNEYGTDYTIDGTALTVTAIVQTEMACLDAGVMEQEARYTALLGAVESFTLTNDRLTLTAPEGVLVFERGAGTGSTSDPALPADPDQPVSATAVPTATLAYLWPDVLPAALAIVPAQSYADETGFVLVVADATGAFSGMLSSGAYLNVAGEQHPDAQPTTVRGQAGYAYASGAGYSLGWAEHGTAYRIAGKLLPEDARALAAGLEAVDLATWQEQLTRATAVDVLRTFLLHLSAGRYAEAATLYDGSYEVLHGWNPSISPDDHAALWEAGCTINGLQCLALDEVIEVQRVTATEYTVTVTLAETAGEHFVHPVNGQERFDFGLAVRDGQFLVRDLPPYVP
jgi:heat shock protein HslJ